MVDQAGSPPKDLPGQITLSVTSFLHLLLALLHIPSGGTGAHENIYQVLWFQQCTLLLDFSTFQTSTFPFTSFHVIGLLLPPISHPKFLLLPLS